MPCHLTWPRGPTPDDWNWCPIMWPDGFQKAWRPEVTISCNSRLSSIILIGWGPRWGPLLMGRLWVPLWIHCPDSPSSGPWGPTTLPTSIAPLPPSLCFSNFQTYSIYLHPILLVSSSHPLVYDILTKTDLFNAKYLNHISISIILFNRLVN